MGRKGGSQNRGSVRTKTRREIDEDETDAYLKAEEEEVLRLRADQTGSITAADAGLEDDIEEVESDIKLTMEIKEVDGELPPGFEESLERSIADGTAQNVVKEDTTLSLPVSASAVRITQDTVEPVKINKSKADVKRKGEKRKRQSDQVDIQSEDMLKLRAALEGKSRSNGVFGSTVSKSHKAQKRQKLAKRTKFELKVLAGAGVRSEGDGRNESEVFASEDDDMVDSDDGKSEGSEDEFYKQVRQNKEAKRAAKAEFYSREPSSTLFLQETVVGKRLVSTEILSNTGLTRHRNKDKKNPRKNYRDKYTDKVKRRGGQVREIRKPSGPYGGEHSGINTKISRCIRFKN